MAFELFLVLHDPGEGRHDGAWDQVARIAEVRAMPLGIVLAADARKIGARSLGAEHVGGVVDELVGRGDGGIDALPSGALGVGEQRACLLGVAIPAALADIDGAPVQFLRGVGPQFAGDALRGVGIVERPRPGFIDQRRHDGGQDPADEEESEGEDDGESCAGIGFSQHRCPLMPRGGDGSSAGPWRR